VNGRLNQEGSVETFYTMMIVTVSGLDGLDCPALQSTLLYPDH